jgi:ABC-2 type transport system permease protein
VNRLGWGPRKARALFVHAFAMMTEYRAETIIWMISGSLPLVMMAVWISLAAAGPVGGYDAADFAAYFLIVFLVRQLTVVWVVWELDREIRLGELSPKLLRPIDPLWGHVVDNLAEKVLRLPLILVPVVIGLLLTGALPPLTLTSLGGFVLLVGGAWVVRFFQQYATGLLTFWTDQTVGLERVWFSVSMVLSGALAPLDLFPAAVRAVLPFTPFPYLVDLPVQALLGRLSGGELLTAFVVQAAWGAAFVLGTRLLWRRGLRRYGAVGA